MAPVKDIGSEECPVSLMSRYPQASAWVTDVLSAMRVKEATGCFPGGPDSAKWPARWYDLVDSAFIEERRIDMARNEVRDQCR